MKKDQNSRISLPIIHWLFLLFLTAGLSDFSGLASVKNQVYPVETANFRPSVQRRKPLSLYSKSDPSPFRVVDKNWLTTIKFLSRQSTLRTATLYVKQTLDFQSFAKNLALRFLLTITHSRASVHPSYFIS